MDLVLETVPYMHGARGADALASFVLQPAAAALSVTAPVPASSSSSSVSGAAAAPANTG